MSSYEYLKIFNEYGATLRDLLLNCPDRPYPLYELLDDYNSNLQDKYKGLLVWDSYRYYKTVVDANQIVQVPQDQLQRVIGYFIVPEFSRVDIIPNFEYKQLVVISFDSCVEPDFDPFQKRIIEVIDWFLNKHNEVIEKINCGFELSDSRRLYANVVQVSNPIIATNSSYVRRSVTITLRYCGVGYSPD